MFILYQQTGVETILYFKKTALYAILMPEVCASLILVFEQLAFKSDELPIEVSLNGKFFTFTLFSLCK